MRTANWLTLASTWLMVGCVDDVSLGGNRNSGVISAGDDAGTGGAGNTTGSGGAGPSGGGSGGGGAGPSGGGSGGGCSREEDQPEAWTELIGFEGVVEPNAASRCVQATVDRDLYIRGLRANNTSGVLAALYAGTPGSDSPCDDSEPSGFRFVAQVGPGRTEVRSATGVGVHIVAGETLMLRVELYNRTEAASESSKLEAILTSREQLIEQPPWPLEGPPLHGKLMLSSDHFGDGLPGVYVSSSPSTSCASPWTELVPVAEGYIATPWGLQICGRITTTRDLDLSAVRIAPSSELVVRSLAVGIQFPPSGPGYNPCEGLFDFPLTLAGSYAGATEVRYPDGAALHISAGTALIARATVWNPSSTAYDGPLMRVEYRGFE